MQLNRRKFLGLSVNGIMALTQPFALSSAQANNNVELSYVFQPDGIVKIAGKDVEIDVALLSDEGHITTGFLASLDPFHGKAFQPGWGAVYDPYLKNGIRSTKREDIQRVITHIGVHGINENDLVKAYQMAEQVWKARPDLRRNTALGPIYHVGDGDSYKHEDYTPLLGSKHDHD